MTLNASGPISLGGSTAGQSVNLELGVSATTTRSFNDAAVRTLTGTTAGTALVMPTGFYGKSNFTPTTVVVGGGGTGSSAHTSGTYTIPTGATHIVIEVWGGGGWGAAGDDNSNFGGGGGAGGYCRSVSYACSGGQTINWQAGVQNDTTASTVTSGTLAVTSMTANLGGLGTNAAGGGAGGAGGTATAAGGNIAASTTGQAGTAGTTSAGIGGTGTTGVHGGPYGKGVNGKLPNTGFATASGDGAIVVYLT